jgi:hypothetical protein
LTPKDTLPTVPPSISTPALPPAPEDSLPTAAPSGDSE